MSRMAFWQQSHESQRLQYSITPAPDRPLTLASIGGQLVAIAEMLQAREAEDGPEDEYRCFLAGIDMDEAGKITFDIVVAPKLPEPEPSSQEARHGEG